jgi:myosin V
MWVVCLFQGSQTHIVVGSQVWVEDPVEAWIDGEVVDINGDEISINNSGKTVGSFIKFSYPSCYNPA